MTKTLKIKGLEIAVSSANTVANTTVVRCFNNSGSDDVITVANSGGTYANLTIASYDSVVIVKQPTDTVQGTNILATPIGHTY